MGTVVVFPGQGSQRAGMARDFHDEFAVARAAFEEASEALDLDVAALCFEEDPRLDLTEFTQPAIVTAEIAMTRALESEFGLEATHFGGHSLGEYTALCAAGVVPLAVVVQIVRRRGALMQAAVQPGVGAMAAVLSPGISDRDLSEVVYGLEVDVANRNALDQVVLSGEAKAVEQASTRLEELLAAEEPRIVPLNVSAPFHSRLMKVIEPEFRTILEAAADQFDATRAATVSSNFSGGFHEPEAESLRDKLTRQISGTVDWIANMDCLAAAGDRLIEVGPNRPLGRFFKTSGHEAASIISLRSARKVMGS